MIRFVSTRGGIPPTDFETAVTQGFASDGGLFVPETIPEVSPETLKTWSGLGFVDLAFEILSLFIDRSVMSAGDLRRLLADSFGGFGHPEIVPVTPLGLKPGMYVMELFHGPTLSFKDVAMGFLINTMDFFLKRSGGRVSLLVATTGDTGPAAAYATAGKDRLDCWVLYPRGFISGEQERQITTLDAPNVHPVGVTGCPNGGDDLDVVVAGMFADEELKRRLSLSSVNSINWCRVMVQAVHYFYGYFRVADRVGDRVVFSVPTGAFGNLFGGYLARRMGLPVSTFVCANNRNAGLHRAFTQGVLTREDLKKTVSSAIDIAAPYNFWRYLYFASGGDGEKIRGWMSDFETAGEVRPDEDTRRAMGRGFASASISDGQTLSTMERVYRNQGGYLLDPHTAVAVAATEELSDGFEPGTKTVCLATAHPAKFPDVVRKALGQDGELPGAAVHESIEDAKRQCQNLRLCDHAYLAPALRAAMTAVDARRRGREGS